jgi:hypothetical protein
MLLVVGSVAEKDGAPQPLEAVSASQGTRLLPSGRPVQVALIPVLGEWPGSPAAPGALWSAATRLRHP